MQVEMNHRYKPNEATQDLASKGLLITPPLGGDEDWLFRVRVSESQSVVGFPKFTTIGIGFQKEEDWNTNLPYTTAAEEIYEHIKHNGPDIDKSTAIKAIKLIQEATRVYRNKP